MTKQQLLDKAMQLHEQNRTTCSDVGLCVACGEEQDGVEPDARKYECDSCGERKVYGAEELLIMLGL